MSTPIVFSSPALPTDEQILAHPAGPDTKVFMYLQKEAARSAQSIELSNALIVARLDTLLARIETLIADNRVRVTQMP